MDMDGLFWVSAFVIGYVYVGYPLLLARVGAARGRGPVRNRRFQPGRMAGRFDRHRGAQRSALACRHVSTTCSSLTIPAPREIIVVSDGSTDGTADALPSSPAHGVAARRSADRSARGRQAARAQRRRRGGDRRDPRLCRRAAAFLAPTRSSQLVANFADPRSAASPAS